MANFISKALDDWALGRVKPAFRDNNYPQKDFIWGIDKPKWVALSTPEHFEKAARTNPIVKAAINILANAASNARKVLVDINTGEVIPWTTKDESIQKAYDLFVRRPNPLQSAREFRFQGTFYLKTFGNRYVYANMPEGYNSELDLLNINTLFNLPSQFINIKTTGKLYDQTTIEGIIEEYALTNYSPVKIYTPTEILHFNEVNISSNMASIMGISKMEVLKMPITNSQLAFEAMNSLLASRGMQGIISPTKKDGMGGSIQPTSDEKKEYDEKFKQGYGTRSNQNLFWLAPFPMDYIKTVLSSKELGIYEEFSNNAILISNEYGVPPQLVKTYIHNDTYENQVQSVRRLYQDTVIPMVADEDEYWSNRLNTYQYGFRIESRWDHIVALQEAYKEKAAALSMNSKAAKDAYDNNIITWNQYLVLLDLKTVPEGDKLKNERNIEQ